MTLITGGIFILSCMSFLIFGIQTKGSWKYKSVKRVMYLIRKRGWQLPEWMTKDVLLNVWITRITVSFVAFVIAIINSSSNKEIHQIQKPEYGQGSIQEELDMEWINENGESEHETIQFQVNEKRLTKEEAFNYIEEVKEQLPEIILGDNESLEFVNHPLELINTIDGIPVDISWLSSDTEIINYDGSLGMDIPQAGKEVCLTAWIQVQDIEDRYIQYVTAYPQKLDMQTQIEYWLEKQTFTTDEKIILPKQWNDMELSWKKVKGDKWVGIIVLLLGCPVFYVMKCRQNYEEKRKNKQTQLALDYPRVLNKLTLLLSAGLNIRKSMERISYDYKKYKDAEEQRFAYEEIITLLKEMDNGISEKQAYERFGERCGILSYRTLSALMIQHLQKGGDDIQRVLEEECKKAQEYRIAQVKIMGEKASTKLLFPMLLMLIIVFVIILVPAWVSFSI